MSFSPEGLEQTDPDMMEVSILAQSLLADRPWTHEHNPRGQSKLTRSLPVPAILADTAEVQLTETQGATSHFYRLTKEALGEFTSWGWLVGDPDTRWLTKIVLESDPTRSEGVTRKIYSKVGFEQEEINSLYQTLVDLDHHMTFDMQFPDRSQPELPVTDDDEVILIASYDPELEKAVLRSINVDNSEIYLEELWKVVELLAVRYKIARDVAIVAIERCIDRVDEAGTPWPIITRYSFGDHTESQGAAEQ